MDWWGWMILGAVLLGSELLVVDAAFYLIFLGVAAAITGAVVLLGVPIEPWLQWIMFGTLSLVAMVTFRQRLYNKLRGDIPDYTDGPVGELIRIEADLAAGDSCRQAFRGTTWTVINRSEADIKANAEVQISEVNGLNLIIK